MKKCDVMILERGPAFDAEKIARFISVETGVMHASVRARVDEFVSGGPALFFACKDEHQAKRFAEAFTRYGAPCEPYSAEAMKRKAGSRS